MKPIAIFILVFGLGLGMWLVATGSTGDILSINKGSSNSPDSSTEVFMNDNNMESNEKEITNIAQTEDSPNNEETEDTEISQIVAKSESVEEKPNDITETQSSETNSVSEEETTAEKTIEPEEIKPTVVAEASTEENSSKTTPQTTMTPVNPHMGNMWMPSSQNPMNYHSWMGPMFNMMMSMMGPMMNPATYMNPMTMMNHPMTAMTQAQNLDFMMRSMDPHLIFGMYGQPSESYKNGEVPDQLPVVTIPGFPTQTYLNWPKNKVSPGVSREAKKNAFQTMMGISPLSMRDMLSIMADKIPVAEDVSWDDAVEAMKLRANEVNFKYVGSSPLWKEIEAVTEQPSARVEIFRFCDAAVAREILDEIPEFIVFLPCKIALIEDGDGKLWVMTLDWDVSWLDFAQNPNTHLAKDLREDAVRIRENIQYIMEGAATGDF